MQRYEIELPEELSSCDECPCRDETTGNIAHGWLDCQLASRRIPERYEAGEFSPYQFAYHDKPDWCPMRALE